MKLKPFGCGGASGQPQLTKLWGCRKRTSESKAGRGNGFEQALLVTLVLVCQFGLRGQAPTPVPSVPISSSASYVADGLVPGDVLEYLIAFGDRLRKPGKERVTLTGTHTDQNGSVPAVLTWEVPGRVRYERAGKQPIVFDTAGGLLNSASVTTADLSILESFLQDSPEAFFYGYVRGQHAYRFLGGRYRLDDGTATDYKGPLYDIYDTIELSNALSIFPQRVKRVYFDSDSRLFTKTQYDIAEGVSVSTEYGKWTTNNGQAVPGQITRTVNGVVTFSFDVTASAVGPSVSDGKFPAN